jgi:hypothetical protein
MFCGTKDKKEWELGGNCTYFKIFAAFKGILVSTPNP